MAKHLERNLSGLKKEILGVGSRVEEAVNKSILALVDRRSDLAEEVRVGDQEIDDLEIKVEEECLKLLALHQPVAHDLRFVIAMMKVNNDLERVGDLAGNIAERAIFMAGKPEIAVPRQITEMAERVRGMLHDALNAVIERSTALAQKVLLEDQYVDSRHIEVYTVVQNAIRERPDQVELYIQLLSVSRYLERMADLATNIAEDVVFMVDGQVIRHQGH